MIRDNHAEWGEGGRHTHQMVSTPLDKDLHRSKYLGIVHYVVTPLKGLFFVFLQ